MDELIQTQVTKILDDLDKSTIAAFASLTLLLLSYIQNSKEVEVFKLKLQHEKVGLVIYFILCGINIQILKLFHNLSSLVKLIKDLKIKEEVFFVIKSHNWLFNPFASTNGFFSVFIDNLGFSILIIMWWVGFGLANHYVLKENKINTINKFLFYIYLFVGLGTFAIIQDLIIFVNPSIATFVSQVVGILIGGYIFRKIKNNFNDKIYLQEEEAGSSK